jgi:RimJ/RimL family protein N-acetyltransferase
VPYHLYSDEVEIGWRFNVERWGNGYVTEAASIVLDHAFNSVKLQKVVADINPLNVSSINVAERLGMRHVEDRIINNERSKSYQVKRSSYLKSNKYLIAEPDPAQI